MVGEIHASQAKQDAQNTCGAMATASIPIQAGFSPACTLVCSAGVAMIATSICRNIGVGGTADPASHEYRGACNAELGQWASAYQQQSTYSMW